MIFYERFSDEGDGGIRSAIEVHKSGRHRVPNDDSE
jgi:hypothetical protein